LMPRWRINYISLPCPAHSSRPLATTWINDIDQRQRSSPRDYQGLVDLAL
jgi:hypothetical protein